MPTLVPHGADDVMCDVSGGRATAAAIPDAKLVIIDGMGHSLPRQLWPEMATHAAELVHGAEVARVWPARGSGVASSNGNERAELVRRSGSS